MSVSCFAEANGCCDRQFGSNLEIREPEPAFATGDCGRLLICFQVADRRTAD